MTLADPETHVREEYLAGTQRRSACGAQAPSWRPGAISPSVLPTLATIIRLQRLELSTVGDGDRIRAVIAIIAFSTAQESAILPT